MVLDVKLKELIDKAKNSGYVQGVQGETDLDAAKDFCGKLLNEANNRSKGKGSPYFPLRTDAGLEDILKKSEELVRALDKLNNGASVSARRTPPPPANSPWRAPAGRPPVQQQRASGNPPQVPPRGRAPAQLPQMPQGGYQTPVQQQRTQGSQPATATPTRKPRVRLGPPPRPATQGGQTQVPPIDATTNNHIGTPTEPAVDIPPPSGDRGEFIPPPPRSDLAQNNNNRFNTMPRTQIPFENGGYPQGEQGDNNENEVNTNPQVASEPSKNDNVSADSKKTNDPKKMLGILYDDIINNSYRMENPEGIGEKEYYLKIYDRSNNTVDSLIELTRQLYFAWGFGDKFTSQLISTLLSYVLEYEGEEVSEKKFFGLISYVDEKFNELCKELDADEKTKKAGKNKSESLYKFRDSLQLETASIERTERELVKQCRDFDRLNSNVKIGPLESCENVDELFESLKKLVTNLSEYSETYYKNTEDEELKLSLTDEQNKFINEGSCKDWKNYSEEDIKKVLFYMDAILQSTGTCIDELKKKEKIKDHSTLDRKEIKLKEDLIEKFNAKLRKLCNALNEKIPDEDKVSYNKSKNIDRIIRRELNLLKKIENYKELTIKGTVNGTIKSVSDNLIRLQEEGLTRKNYKDIVTKTNKALKDIGVIIEYLSYHDNDKRGKKVKEIIDNSVKRMNILIDSSGLKDDINFDGECGNDLRTLNKNMEEAYDQMLEHPGSGLEKSWKQISDKPGVPLEVSEKVIERNLGYVADVVSAISASPEVEQPKENVIKRAFVKLKSVFKKKPKDSKLNEIDIQTCFKAAGNYFQKAYDAAEKEKNDKKKDKHFTAAGLIKNFSALKKTDWYKDFRGMLEGTKTTVKSSKDGKKGDILLCKLFISFLGLGSAKNVETACTGFMKSTIEGKPKDICSVIRSKCLGGTDQGKLRTQLEKILTTGNDKKISLSKFNKIAEYFKNSSWFDNEKKSEENEPQQEQPKQDATIPVAPPLPGSDQSGK